MTAELRVHVSDLEGGMTALFDRFRAFAVSHHVPIDIQREIHLALDEIVTNVIRHGYGGQPCDGADIRVSVAAGSLQVEVRDRARPFNPLEIAEPDISLPPEMREIGGLGLYFVRQLMDSVEYRRHDGQNCVLFSRRFGKGMSRR